jgi:hypothetical protein
MRHIFIPGSQFHVEFFKMIKNYHDYNCCIIHVLCIVYGEVSNTLNDFLNFFRWTGSDTNPLNNDGQGKKGSDRNNALLLRDKSYPEGNGVQYGPAPTYGQFGNNYPMRLNESQFLGLSEKDLIKLAFLEPGMFYRLY